jgi:sialate O-acetylesterase
LAAAVAAALLCGAAGGSAEELRFARIFGDGMVLQRDRLLPVWGRADPGEKVRLTFAGQSVEVEANGEGLWMAPFRPLAASAEGRELAVAGRDGRKVVLTNVVVGEVWVCAGQSNMDRIFAIDAGKDGFAAQTNTVATVDDPLIRFVKPEFFASFRPLDDFDEYRHRDLAWRPMNTNTIFKSSSLPYYFAKELHTRLGVPVGLVQLAVSGTTGLAWLREDLAAERLPRLLERARKTGWEKMKEEGFESAEVWASKEETWRVACAEAVAAGGKRLPEWPGHKPRLAVTNQRHVLYNALVRPCGPFAARGVIWHQGEGGPYEDYDVLLECLARQWREQQGTNLCFLWGTLALDSLSPADAPRAPGFGPGVLRGSIQGQILANGRIPNAAGLNFLDLGDGNLHWGAKDIAGLRMATAALELCHGQTVRAWRSPQFESLATEDGKVRIRFRDAEGGLVWRTGDGQTAVAIAGEDGVFRWARTVVQGLELLAWSDDVPRPVHVAYEWAPPHVLPLASRDGVLALPFYARDGRPMALAEADARRLAPRAEP